MARKNQHLIKRILIILISFICLVFLLNKIIAYRFTQYLKNKEVKGLYLSYDGLDLNILDGSAIVEKPIVILNDSLGANINGNLQLESIKINNVDYARFLFTGDINVSSLELNKPIGNLHKSKRKIEKENDPNKQTKVENDINLEHLLLNNAFIKYYNSENELTMSLNNFSLDIHNILVNQKTLQNSLPFTCKSYTIDTDSIFVKTNQFYQVNIKGINGDNYNTIIKGFSYTNKYSPKKYSGHLTKEKDYYKVSVDSIGMYNLSLINSTEERLKFGADSILFYQSDINIYRDKLLADDVSYKPMYGELLRKSKLDIAIDNLWLKKTKLVYSEKVKSQNKAGDIRFYNMNLHIRNLGNGYTENTQINTRATFMKNTPFMSNWIFNPKDPKDRFEFKGRLGELNLSDLDRLTNANLNLSVSGKINRLQFLIKGNNTKATSHIETKFEGVKVALLKENKKKKKFLSTIANWFVKDDSGSENNSETSISEIEVDRNQQKSVLNYIFTCVKEGLAKVLM